MITAIDLAKEYGAQTLFREANFQLNPGSRYGLVGANGSGKTTLLRMLSGDEEPTTGSVGRPKKLRLGVLEQDHFRFEEVPIIEVVMRGHGVLWSAITEKERVLETADTDFDADRYAELEDIVVSLDGYSFEARCGEILEGLGIPTDQHGRPMSTLSGGFKLRVLLARVLAAEPDCLFLDEPTNHLDILSIRWLEKFLVDYPGCAVVISHDHRFLDNVCTHILDVDYETVALYTGNFTSFTKAKRMERERKEAEIAKREKEIAHHQAFVDRFRAKNTKARQAQSKVKQIEKMAVKPLPPSSRRYPVFSFSQQRPSGKQVLEIEGISKSFGSKRVLNDVSLNLRRGDRLAVIGPNGIGKSTLLKILMGRIEADAGDVEWGHQIFTGYFAQDHEELLAGSDGTVEGWLGAACPGQTIGWVRSQLGKVLFTGDEVEKRVASLSGGEAARLIFARLAVDHPNVLVLDEPTNHLDLEAIEALVEALKAYDGSLIFVAHDRWFVSQLATRILEITENALNDYPGTYDDYLADCGDDHLDVDAATLRAKRQKKKARRPQEKRKADPDERRRAKRRKDLGLRLEVVTAAVEKNEARIEAIDTAFCRDGFFEETAESKVRALQKERTSLESEVASLMEEWETIETELARD
ncbi:MAG: ABC-F family ATP-binding cassette domain-containing protein [Thermoanaerobaculales bacterium]|jgi:ATPase subunit of ABC transporter with duplicated ATPase domains|nr:ABC-F family ATP-binding cassette domain-containing protein [Thermoanaerobaculales bacterium]